MLAGTLCFTLMNAFAKQVGHALGEIEGLQAMQITFSRYAIAVLLILPFVRFTRGRLPITSLTPYLVRTSAGFGGIFLMFAAVQLIPLTLASALGLLAPVFAMILSALLLHERADGRLKVALVFGLGGVWSILQPASGASLLGTLMGLASAACMGLELVLLRYLAKGQDSKTAVLFVSNLLGAVLSGTILLILNDLAIPNLQQASLLLVLAAAAVFGQICFLTAAGLVSTPILAPFLFSSLVYTVLIDIMWFGDPPNFWTALGIGGILACGALSVRQRPHD